MSNFKSPAITYFSLMVIEGGAPKTKCFVTKEDADNFIKFCDLYLSYCPKAKDKSVYMLPANAVPKEFIAPSKFLVSDLERQHLRQMAIAIDKGKKQAGTPSKITFITVRSSNGLSFKVTLESAEERPKKNHSFYIKGFTNSLLPQERA